MDRRLPLTQLNADQRQRLFNFAAVTATIMVGAAMIVGTYLWFGVDFRAFYVAGKLTLDGQDPYNYDLAVPLLLEFSDTIGNAPFYYPPWFALFMVPFAMFSYPVARALWLLLCIGSWGLSVWLTRSILDWRVRGWRQWLMILSMLYLMVWVCIRSEQTGTLICFSLALALWATKKGWPALAGLGMALTLTKPQIAVFPWLFLTFIAFKRHRWKVLASFIVCLGGLLVISTLVIPGWYRHVLKDDFGLGLKSMVEGPGIIVGKRLTSTLPDLLWFIGLPGLAANVLWAVVGFLGVAGLSGLWLGKAGLLYVLVLSTPIWFLITPYAMQYDYVLMTLPTMCIYRGLGRMRGWRYWAGVGVLVFAHSLLLWQGLSIEGLWLPTCVGFLLVWIRLGLPAADIADPLQGGETL